jgi:7-carboxy-7-deazaguanine synthase
VSETTTLRVSEVFFSLQGESSRVGLPTVFIRLTGCPLRCGYCDTAYAFAGGENMAIAAILQQVSNYGARYVTVTGGEPLAQKACLKLLTALSDAKYSVSLETSGALDISNVDTRVSKVMDIKTPGSGEVDKNNWLNLEHLTQQDELKFVLCDEIDYQWACKVINERHLDQICPILFSPVHGTLNPTSLANWILRDKLPVRMQIQLHKLLWDDGPGR